MVKRRANDMNMTHLLASGTVSQCVLSVLFFPMTCFNSYNATSFTLLSLNDACRGKIDFEYLLYYVG